TGLASSAKRKKEGGEALHEENQQPVALGNSSSRGLSLAYHPELRSNWYSPRPLDRAHFGERRSDRDGVGARSVGQGKSVRPRRSHSALPSRYFRLSRRKHGLAVGFRLRSPTGRSRCGVAQLHLSVLGQELEFIAGRAHRIC